MFRTILLFMDFIPQNFKMYNNNNNNNNDEIMQPRNCAPPPPNAFHKR